MDKVIIAKNEHVFIDGEMATEMYWIIEGTGDIDEIFNFFLKIKIKFFFTNNNIINIINIISSF